MANGIAKDTNKISIAAQTLGTVLILYSWVAIAYGNTLHNSILIPPYPYNYVAEIAGCFLWSCVGVWWKNPNVVIVNGVLCILATIGIFTN